jgi:uncharacterized membrane protein YvbJ
MKYCKFCGEEVSDDAVVCRHCGRQIEELQSASQEGSGMGIAAIIFGALGGWLGLIFGIIGLVTYKLPQNRRNCKIGIGLFLGWIVLYVILIVVSVLTMGNI